MVEEALEGLGGGRIEEIVAVVNELAAVSMHEGEAGELVVTLSFDDFVVVEVLHSGPNSAAALDRLSRKVVDGFSIRWGDESTDTGRLLWAELEL